MGGFQSTFLDALRNRIDMKRIPFTDRGSRGLVFCHDNQLSVQLAERPTDFDIDKPGADSVRLPLIEGWEFLDENGNPLPLAITTYPHCVICETPIGEFRLTFFDVDTLCVALPKARCGFRWKHHHHDSPPAYATDALVIDSKIDRKMQVTLDALEGNKGLLVSLKQQEAFNPPIPSPDSVIEASARRWHDWFAAAPGVLDHYRQQYLFAWWVMGAGLVSPRGFITRESMMPSKTKYIGIWHWDNFFHAMAYRHVDARLAQDQLRILLDHQREDGMIPDAIHDAGVVSWLGHPVPGDVTKPPLIGWAAWKLHQHQPDVAFLKDIYEGLVRANNWWFEKNDHDGDGLCEYLHPYSSGLDDSPLWDGGVPAEAPDLNSYLVLQQDALGNIAKAIGETADVQMWADSAQMLAERMVNQMWDAKVGYFPAKVNRKRVRVRTPFNLFPLITGRMPKEIAERLVKHLTNPQEFWTAYPVPTVAANDAKFSAETMWRGPVWINVNYLLIEGLQRSGYQQVARDLRTKTLDMVAGQPDIYEYYNPLTGTNPTKSASTFGWSAALFIDLAIQATSEADGSEL